MLAARMRPESLPAYEVLYKTAEEIAAKREELRRAAEAAKLKVGRGEWETAHCAGSLRAGRWLEDVRPLDPCWRIPAAKPNASPIRYSASQECLFHPVMVAEPKAKEGRALKLVAELTQVAVGCLWSRKRDDHGVTCSCAYHSGHAQQHAAACATRLPQSKRTTTEEEAPAEEPEEEQQPAARSQGGEQGSGQGGKQPSSDLPFDALERQINDALVRLSLSEEQVAASLQRAQGGAAQQAQLAGVQGGWPGRGGALVLDAWVAAVAVAVHARCPLPPNHRMGHSMVPHPPLPESNRALRCPHAHPSS